MALALDPSLIFQATGRTADPWQRELLLSTEPQVLLNCSRQTGKSTTVAALALHTALFAPGSLTLILSPTQRQSFELFRKILDAYNAINRPIPCVNETMSGLQLANSSRIVALPGKEASVRSYSAVALLIIDEASRVPDDLYRSIRPMLAISRGRLVCLSTPFGQRGFFYDEWTSAGPWKKVEVTWKDCPRISEGFIAEERRAMGELWVKQEYECSFTAMEGLVYPDFNQSVVDIWPLPRGSPVGGIDFGWRNPFAAVWGVLDKQTDTLWIGWERYQRETPLHEHAEALRKHKQVMWYADPAGATEIAELRAADLAVRKGDNTPGSIRLGIAAITARIQSGRLKVLSTTCPNLIAEAQLYRYPAAHERQRTNDNPLDENNHALGALRYLVSRLDYKFIAKLRKKAPSEGPIEQQSLDMAETAAAVHGAKIKPKREGPDFDDPAIWSGL